MILYPNIYLENVLKIDENIIKKNQIKGLLLDVDNTLMHYDKTIISGIEEWIKKMKNIGIKLCILSNSNDEKKVKKLADELDIPYIHLAYKPFKIGFKKAKKILNIDYKNIGMVGDQIFTDVLGANRMKMISILIKPLEKREYIVTKVKRPLEEAILRSYFKKKYKF